jgi:hypothetical protein
VKTCKYTPVFSTVRYDVTAKLKQYFLLNKNEHFISSSLDLQNTTIIEATREARSGKLDDTFKDT